MFSRIKKILGFLSEEDKDPFFVKMKELTGCEANNIHLFHLAFKHKSKNKENNERLEFLGDSILDAVISELIYKHFPLKNEGELSKLRSKMVSRNMLNKLAHKLQLLELLSYRETHTADGLRNTEGNTMEALIGAIYLDQGYGKTKEFVLKKLIQPHIDWQKLEKEIVDHKSLLYTYSQKEGKDLYFEVLNDDVKNLKNRFLIAVKLDNVEMAQATGKSKKIAEQKAAEIFWKSLGDKVPTS